MTQKRLFWILLILAIAATIAALLLLRSRQKGDEFGRLMTVGAGYLQNKDATNAIATYQKLARLAPENIDVHLNLANAYLLAGNSPAVITECQAALALDRNNPAPYYLMGCAYLRLDQPEPAVQAFQQSQRIDPAVTALNFQLGVAHERLGQLDDAARQFETVVQFEPDHPSAHYQLSRLYQRLGRTAEAEQELAKHQEILAKNPRPPSGPFAFEQSKYTEPRVAFTLEQPEKEGIPVKFIDATANAFGEQSSQYHGPIGVLDYNHDGRNSLFVVEGDGFRLLNNSNGQFSAIGVVLPGTSNAVYRKCLVGDLNNDRFEDVVVLGEQGSQVFRFATNGEFRDFSTASGLKGLKAKDGILADLDFTGKLDLLTILPEAQGLREYRNLGSFYFQDNTAKSGLPESLPGSEHLAVEDYNSEDLPNVFVTRSGQPPKIFGKQRAGVFVETNLGVNLPVGTFIALGDLNNDLRPDIVLADDREIKILFNGTNEKQTLPLKGLQPKGILLLDYDNDGWLDVIAFGSGIRVWRNVGKSGFDDVTSALSLGKAGPVESVAAADFDQDGDTDLVLSTAGGLQYWRNDGGNANKQLKLQLVGNRSNSSALGVGVEIVAGNWRTLRTLNQLPFEIGVGKHERIDVLKARWSDLATTVLEVPVQPQPLSLAELTVPAGSCPNLYAWDGKHFRFVTDILCASPMGLPINSSRYVEADPEEFLALGNEQQFPGTNGFYEVRVTEELREVLYLDQAKLFVVDHPAGTVLHPTSKMHPGKPFPPHELWTLRPFAALKRAMRSDGLDVTEALAATDQRMVSPIRLREPQLRGLAEPFSMTMDFGELPVEQPLVLVLNGWIRFGGGMANIAASRDSNLPFPFPTLEAELPDGSWKPVATDVGVPAGKTKTIIVDLEKKLPTGSRRLRLSTAFEIYWNSAALCLKAASKDNHVTTLEPERADLRWHGFSQYEPLPEWLPLTPKYEKVQSTPPWNRTPAGWCTRYGRVNDLVREKDNALALLNGGDEVALAFRADRLPPKPSGFERDFFLYVVGWDKDADFHVGEGWRVEPLPFLGMDDQAYGRQARPPGLNHTWTTNYNTRWVGPLVLRRINER